MMIKVMITANNDLSRKDLLFQELFWITSVLTHCRVKLLVKERGSYLRHVPALESEDGDHEDDFVVIMLPTVFVFNDTTETGNSTPATDSLCTLVSFILISRDHGMTVYKS